jgi:serine/threonine protein kinase
MSLLSNTSDPNSSKVSKSLNKYDEVLHDIIVCQSPETTSPIVAVNGNDLQKVALLGNGQFCNVHSVAGSLQLPNQDQEQEFSARKRKVYAMKSINPTRVADDHELIIAATDLACEAKILSELDHENVIKLRGLSCETFSQSFAEGVGLLDRNMSQRSLGFGGRSTSQIFNRSTSFKNGAQSLSFKRMSSFKISKSSNGIEGYFILLDLLTEVLSDRLTRERKNKERESSKLPKKKAYKIEAMYERIRHVVTGIVAGMRYLHSQEIVLRDLKPGNVGFDEEMNVRLFDFGMARKVSECDPNEVCGSPRYMAPEIMQGNGYTLKVDVYSFGVLLYELCTLEAPFADSFSIMRLKQKKTMSLFQSIFGKRPRAYKEATTLNSDDTKTVDEKDSSSNLLDKFYRRVIFDELRPSNNNLDPIIPCPKIRNLIQECWAADPEKRPSFDEIATRLEAIFNPQ